MNWKDEVREVVLPEWLQECLPPEDKPVYTIFWEGPVNGGNAVVKTEEGEVWGEFATVPEAYDSVKTDTEADIVFDESIDGKGGRLDEGMWTASKVVRGGMRALFSSTDDDKLALLKHSYKNWTDWAYPNWLENQDSIDGAYNYLSNHPVFWVRHDDEPTYHWETSSHTLAIWHALMQDDKGGFVWALETGSHIEPDYVSHYHDLRLDVYAPTFEEALIELAKRVEKFFNPDGTAKKNVEYEKSDLELVLEERMAEYERAVAEDDAAEPVGVEEV